MLVEPNGSAGSVGTETIVARHNTVQAAVKRLKAIRDLRDEKRLVEGSITENQLEAIALIEDLGQSTLSFEDESVTYKGTVVRGTSLDINALKLKKRLGAARFKKLTTASLDMAKLESAIAAGDVDPADVAACSTESERKPFIRITASKSKRPD